MARPCRGPHKKANTSSSSTQIHFPPARTRPRLELSRSLPRASPPRPLRLRPKESASLSGRPGGPAMTDSTASPSRRALTLRPPTTTLPAPPSPPPRPHRPLRGSPPSGPSARTRRDPLRFAPGSAHAKRVQARSPTSWPAGGLPAGVQPRAAPPAPSPGHPDPDVVVAAGRFVDTRAGDQP